MRVVLKNGKEQAVTKEQLQYLLATGQILSFERSDGWVDIESNEIRKENILYPKENRRAPSTYLSDQWY